MFWDVTESRDKINSVCKSCDCSLENETSFNAIYNYYAKMAQFRNIQEIPIILVGTQGNFL